MRNWRVGRGRKSCKYLIKVNIGYLRASYI